MNEPVFSPRTAMFTRSVVAAWLAPVEIAVRARILGRARRDGGSIPPGERVPERQVDGRRPCRHRPGVEGRDGCESQNDMNGATHGSFTRSLPRPSGRGTVE